MSTTNTFIDDIEDDPAKPPIRDVLGGAGVYSALGARLFSQPPLSKSVTFIVDRGSDFPSSMTDLINSWNTSAYIRDDPSRLTTRAHTGPSPPDGSPRPFNYTTPKLRLTPADLKPEQLASRVFHIMSSPVRCRDIIESITHQRRRIKANLPTDSREADILAAQLSSRPVIIWEPAPESCDPDELLNVTNNLRLVDVFSPNHAELAGLMGDVTLGVDPTTGRGVDKAAVERACEQLLASMPLQSFSLVVRCREAGCFVARNGGRKRGGGAKEKRKKAIASHGGLRSDTDMMSLFEDLMQDDAGFVAREEIEVDPGVEMWFPAHHGEGQMNGNGLVNGELGENGGVNGSSKVVDPTGGGNAFLGGFGVALARGRTVEEAAVYGSVAASFAIEQVGVPVLGRDSMGRETWNGVRVLERLGEFKSRVGVGMS